MLRCKGGGDRCLEVSNNPVKCPKCGFVSFPGLPQCKKCGHSFVLAKSKQASASILSLISRTPSARAPSAAPPPPEESPSQAQRGPAGQPAEAPEREPQLAAAPQAPATAEVRPAERGRPWREELSERVEDFRRRRARLRGDFDPSTNLEFDFKAEQGVAPATQLDAEVIASPPPERELDVELGSPAGLEAETPVLDSLPLDVPEASVRTVRAAALDAGELTLEPRAAPAGPVEVILDSTPVEEVVEVEAIPLVLPMAPLGRRFLAGMLDGLALVAAAGLFALIFWRAGGQLSPQPFNLTVVGFIAAFFILAYFGLFTALTFTTPGLLWLGIEVRTLEGDFPTSRQALWRAFGYLVSTGALLLGFVWALVDSDGFTWHDRMSGTFLAIADSAVEGRKSIVES